MDALWKKEGRKPGLLSVRRLRSFKCFIIAMVSLNILVLLAVSWGTIRNSPAKPSSPIQLGFRIPRNVAENDGGDRNDNRDTVLVGGNVQEKQLPQPASDKRNKVGQFKNVPKYLTTPSSLAQVINDNSVKTACTYRTTVYLNNKLIKLNKSPFSDYLQEMVCFEEGNVAIFSNRFAKFKNVILDSSKVTNTRKGGENLEDVWNQVESDEYFQVLPGYFKVQCSQKPIARFSEADHLSHWQDALTCYNINDTDIVSLQTVHGTTLAIQRYEYVNLYHSMCDFYNAFVLMLIYGVQSSKMNILAVDAHPLGSLDPVWETLFGNFIRAGRVSQPTLFPNLAWGFLGYFSPLNNHDREQVPYLEEFRDFFLSQYNVSTKHALDCQHPNVVLIWRRDYVAHPRNPKGSVVRKFANEDEMVDQVRNVLGEGANVGGLQLDALSMKAQLETIASCDILIGMHGAGMSHILFLPPTSGVIELKPQYSNPALVHFQALARWRNLAYTIWHNFDRENERDNYKTYIPRDIITDTVKHIYKKICYNAR